jgi:excisionase family DNA binding protein
MTTPGCFTIDATAAHLGVSRAQVYNFLRDHRLNAVKIGHRTVVRADEVKRFIDGLPAYRPEGVTS